MPKFEIKNHHRRFSDSSIKGQKAILRTWVKFLSKLVFISVGALESLPHVSPGGAWLPAPLPPFASRFWYPVASETLAVSAQGVWSGLISKTSHLSYWRSPEAFIWLLAAILPLFLHWEIVFRKRKEIRRCFTEELFVSCGFCTFEEFLSYRLCSIASNGDTEH